MSLDCIFSGDTHLSDHTWTSRSQIVGDSIFGFKQLCHLAVSHKCPLILAGDCWELWRNPNPDSCTVLEVRQCIDLLKNNNCKLYFINGQHDNLAPPFWFTSIHDWPIHVGGKSFYVGSKRFYGVDFFPEVALQTVVDEIPADTFCLVIHQAWIDFTGSEIMAKLKLEQLPNVPLIVSGDMHKFLWCQVGNRLCVSPGATHMRTIREPREHYALGFSFTTGVKQLQLGSRPVMDFVVPAQPQWLNSFEQLQATVQKTYAQALQAGYPEEVAKPLVLVTDAYNSGAANLIAEKIANCHVVPKTVSEQSLTDSATEIVQTVDIENLLEQLLSSKGLSQPQLDLIRAVANAEDLYKHLGLGT